jgi:hypothetical protein
MSAGVIVEAGAIPGAGGIATCALSSKFAATLLLDCRPIGVGEVMEGAPSAGAAELLIGDCGGSIVCSIAGGADGGLPLSSNDIAILNVPSTITTTLAPTSSERIFEVMLEESLPVASLVAVFEARAAFSFAGAAAAAWAARRAAAMKLDEETGSRGAAGIALMALSEAAIRSEGEPIRLLGRVPGSSG